MGIRMNWNIIIFLTSLFTQFVHSQDDCANTWITYSGYNVLGGVYNQTPKTVLQCKASCLNFPNSTGFDFDGANRCWITYSETMQKDTSTKPTVTHYQLLKSVNSCTASCNGGKTITWTALVDTHVRGGVATTDTTFLNCLKNCFNDNQCVGFDWDPKNAGGQLCWLSKNSNNIQESSTGVTHYDKDCTDSGTKIVTPGFIPPGQKISSAFSTVPTVVATTTTTANPVVNRPADDSKYVYIKGQAIKPAYIVLAGLGAGCILLVIIAVVTLCVYPLKGGDDHSTYREKKTKKQKGELHTRRPKTLSEEEHIGMSTVTTAVNNNHSYDGNSYKKNSYSGNHNGTLKDHRLTNGSAETVDYKRPDSGDYNKHNSGDYNEHNSGDYNKHNSGDYNHRNSGDYNRRESGDSIRKSGGGYEDATYDRNSHRGSGILDKAEDRVHSMADDAKDEYHHIHDSGADNASYVRDAFD